MAYKGILLIVGLFLAFETRNIKIKELNDSPLIAMCVYTTVVLSISLAPIGILLTNYVDIHYGLLGSLAMLGVTLILSMLFVPQVMMDWVRVHSICFYWQNHHIYICTERKE